MANNGKNFTHVVVGAVGCSVLTRFDCSAELLLRLDAGQVAVNPLIIKHLLSFSKDDVLAKQAPHKRLTMHGRTFGVYELDTIDVVARSATLAGMTTSFDLIVPLPTRVNSEGVKVVNVLTFRKMDEELYVALGQALACRLIQV